MTDHDEPRDDWLKQALHHAPRDAVPPALREAILQASRAPRTSAPAVPWWQRLSAWLVRPQVAAGFASIAMVTVAGLLWHDEPVPQMPSSPPPPAVVVTAPAPARAEAEVAAPRDAAREAPPPEMKAAPPPEAARRAAVPRRAEPPVASGMPKPLPPPAPAAVAEDTAVAPAPMAPPAPAHEMAKEKRLQTADAAAVAKAAPSRSAAPAGALSRSFAPTSATLADVRTALAATPSRWTWEREAGAARPVDGALADWLALLDATVTSTWRPSQELRTGAAEVRLMFDGRTAHRWVLTDDAVYWLSPAGLQQAPLDGAAARRLLEALPTAP